MLYVCYLTITTTLEDETVSSPILKMRELRLTKAKQLAKGHTVVAVRLQSPEAKLLKANHTHTGQTPAPPPRCAHVPHPPLSVSQYPLTMLSDKTDAGIHNDGDVTPAHLLLLQPCASPAGCPGNGRIPR